MGRNEDVAEIDGEVRLARQAGSAAVGILPVFDNPLERSAGNYHPEKIFRSGVDALGESKLLDVGIPRRWWKTDNRGALAPGPGKHVDAADIGRALALSDDLAAKHARVVGLRSRQRRIKSQQAQQEKTQILERTRHWPASLVWTG